MDISYEQYYVFFVRVQEKIFIFYMLRVNETQIISHILRNCYNGAIFPAGKTGITGPIKNSSVILTVALGEVEGSHTVTAQSVVSLIDCAHGDL